MAPDFSQLETNWTENGLKMLPQQRVQFTDLPAGGARSPSSPEGILVWFSPLGTFLRGFFLS